MHPSVLVTAEARRHGIGKARLAGRGFARVTRGAYVAAGSAPDVRARCLAVQLVRPDVVVSHWTALQLLGLPVPPGVGDRRLHVLLPCGPCPPRRAGIAAHRAEGAVPTTRRAGVRVTHDVRTWTDLARAGAGVAQLVAVGDALVQRRPAALAELRLSVRSTWRGVRVARAALALLDPRAESVMESWLRVLLVSAGVPAPEVQHEVWADGRLVARVDLAWPERRLVVEYDGEHHRERSQWVRDLRRREALEQLGWRVVVLTAVDVLRHPCDTVTRVRAALHR